MTASRYGQSLMPNGPASTVSPAASATPTESIEYVCGSAGAGSTGQGYGGNVTVRIYNQATALGQACIGTVWGRASASDVWHIIGQVAGVLTAGTGTSGTATAPPLLTGTNTGGAAMGLPLASTGLMVAGLVEQQIYFPPEWSRIMVAFMGNTTGACTVDAWVNEFETL